ERAAMAAAALVLLGPGTPLLFQGEEWAASSPFPYFCDTSDAELAEQIRAGRRAEFEAFGWPPGAIADPLDREVARAAVLDWDERSIDAHCEALDWYRRLIHLRAALPELARGGRDDTDVRVDEAHDVVVMTRGPVTVVAHLGDGTAEIALAGDG